MAASCFVVRGPMWTRAMATLRVVRPTVAWFVPAKSSMTPASSTAWRTMESEGRVMVEPYDGDASGVPLIENEDNGYPTGWTTSKGYFPRPR